MFKPQNHQPAKANQQLLDEIELISGQKMVELSGQELMNVVGGKQEETPPSLVEVYYPNGQPFLVVPSPPQGELNADPDTGLTVRPDSR